MIQIHLERGFDSGDGGLPRWDKHERASEDNANEKGSGSS
jgi:hypothetical protein